jgi:hypothetical protein
MTTPRKTKSERTRERILDAVIRSDLDLSATRMLILGALNWTAEWYQPRGLSPEEIAHHATAIVLEGLAVDARRGEHARARAS